MKQRSLSIFLLILLAACNGKQPAVVEQPVKEKPASMKISVPEFNADSAYVFVRSQVDFGPRIPGSPAHAACAKWLEQKLHSYMGNATVQRGIATTFDGKKYEIKNIIAEFKPELTNRVLLCAHWDTRPFADRDEGPDRNRIFDGANDGASGVGVLLEIARQLSIAQPSLGIDIILFDLEDYGQPENSTFPALEHSWCLGSQYWGNNPHKPGYYAGYGILLDMVGAKDAVFPKEGASVQYAPAIVDKVWSTASRLGFGSRFINAVSNPITDDHIYVNQLANIPCINIVHYDVNERDFFPHHHRVSDTMDQIDAETLKQVGQTVLQVVFESGS